MDRTDQNLLEQVDARTKLAGSNKMEILLFSLGTHELFGINVFKVREVSRTPTVTPTPNMPGGVEGLIPARVEEHLQVPEGELVGLPQPGWGS